TSDQVAVLHARPVAPVSVPVPTPQPQSPAPIVAQPVAPIVAPPPAPAPRSPAPIKPQPVAPIDPGKPIVSHESPKTPIEPPPAATQRRAFERAAGFRKGEEPYHSYLAVSLYETGRYNAAKRELAAALPYIEVTPDIARYRIKIEGAIE